MRRFACALALALASTACSKLGGDPCNPPREIVVKKVEPPDDNPYPPKTEKDTKRVRLAEATVRAFYTSRLDEAPLRERMKAPHDAELDDDKKGWNAFPYVGKREACVRSVECWSKDYAFLRRVASVASMYPAWIVSKVNMVHVMPWSVRRYEERTLAAESRHYNDDFKISEAAKRDYAKTGMLEAFSMPPLGLKDDEYVVDAIVEMKGKDGYWHIISVETDDDQGEPVLRYFDMIPIQNVTKWSCYR
jgi:hypothetical protein